MRHWLPILACAFLLATAAAPSGAQECAWGSFDATRINYEDGQLNGGAHILLRGIITSHGGTILPGTPVLDANYLAQADVFYTSLLAINGGQLSAAEQSALHDWIAAGGTLIVTADIFPLDAYESFTAFYGVTGYVALSENGTGSVVADHPITEGVQAFNYVTQSTYNYPANALRLADDANGRVFAVVMEPATGFDAGGRILVLGDHNAFTDSQIIGADNSTLANNFAEWACNPEPVAVHETTWGQVRSLFR
ncbi:MAG: DUF4350 domain-containing protein [Candidatus Eisenbacteria bacterium]|nr:hypothetical protein [Candidatus Eisenbacteria bacterium]